MKAVRAADDRLLSEPQLLSTPATSVPVHCVGSEPAKSSPDLHVFCCFGHRKRKRSICQLRFDRGCDRHRRRHLQRFRRQRPDCNRKRRGDDCTTSSSAGTDSPEQVRLEARLALHSVFFPTARPEAAHPDGGLVSSQQGTLSTLATDFKQYLAIKPDARLTLTGHTDVRASAEYNQALSERRVNRAKQFLVEQGVPEGSIDTRAVGKEQELSADEVKALVEQNPDLSDADKKKVLHKLNVIVLAQNRRVDISLSTTGQQSVQLYPFNAADSMTLLDEKAPTPRRELAEETVDGKDPPTDN